MRNKPEQTLSGPALTDLIQAVLERGASVRIQAKGCSMSPFIRNGDVVMLSALPGKSLRLGDVVAFRRPGSDRLAFHRVAGEMGGFYLIRGDNCAEADGLISKNDILGWVSGVERGGSEILFGLGPERHLIAYLSRRNLLLALSSLIHKVSDFCRAMSRPKVLIPTTM